MSWTTGVCEKCGAHCEYKMSWGYEKPNGLDYVGDALLCGDCHKKVASKSSVMRATAILIAGTMLGSGCMTAFVNENTLTNARRQSQAQAFAAMYQSGEAEQKSALRLLAAPGFVGFGMDITRWQAVKEAPMAHLFSASADIGLLIFAQDEYRKSQRTKQESSIVVDARDQARVVVVVGDGQGSSSGDSNTGSGGQVR